MSALRVLIVAEHASKRFGGEAILPYHYFRLLRARNIDAHLIVHDRTRVELEELFPADLDRIRFVPDHPLQKLFFRVGKLLPRRISEATFGLANQLITQASQRDVVRGLLTTQTVLHQPIPVSPKFPSLLSGLGAPLVAGPLNGGMNYPPAFRSAESAVSRALIALGRGLSDFVNTIFPGKKNAAVVLVANARTRTALPSGIRGRIVNMPENAVDLTQWQPPQHSIAEQNAATLLFMGRLVDWKALDIVLSALRNVPAANLDVIGDGPMLDQWRTLAMKFGIGDRVRFLGWLPQQECVPHLATTRALVLPSIYECGGAVVLEAMAMSKPVIATAWGGPADYLDATCGILIPPTSRDALIAGFAEAMQQILDSPEAAEQLGRAGRARLIANFDWERKIDAMLEIYESALAT